MERKKSKSKPMKSLILHHTTIEPPVPIDLSTDITRLFQVSANRKKRISEYMCESIRKTKIKASRKFDLSVTSQPIPRPVTGKDFVAFASTCPSVEMPLYLEKNIRKMIQSPALQQSQPHIFNQIMEEAKEEYSRVLHWSGINQKIKGSYPEVGYKIEPLKFVGKTELYNHYLLTRKRIKTKWILHSQITKKIHDVCVTEIPYPLCQLKFLGIFELEDITYILKDKAQSVIQFIYEFYVKTQAMVDEHYNKEFLKAHNLKYLSACTTIFSVHISNAITNTLLDIIKFTGDKQPYINLSVTFDKNLVLTPTCDLVTTTFHNFMDKILESGRGIHVFQENKIKGFENKNITLCITEEFILNCKSEVAENIERLYEPITLYLENINRDLGKVYPDVNSDDFIESISDITFEIGCEKIMYYREFLNKVAFIPDHEYFQIGQIYLNKYRINLHDGIVRNVDLIFDKLRSQHLWEVSDLCETFQMIHMRAYQRSITTEELIETGKYMNWIKNEHLEEITLRVEASLTSLCQIIDLGLLTEDHIQLNADAINWMNKILPVVEEHLVNFDQLKYEAEEKLQKIVDNVNDAIKAVYPLLVILDDMDDINRVNAYLQTLTLHMNKIKEIEEQIAWINKEEGCLSFPKSTYPEYDELKNYIYPFHHLLRLCLKVQRNLSVWQDGPFENLNYNSTKSSMDSFYKELTDLYKTYRKKLRQAQDENIPIRFKGTIDDPDILNWPAPLKLSGKAMKLLDEFKPSVDITKIICNDSLRKRHWKAMSEIAGIDITPNAGTTLRKMMKIDFYANLNEYEIISIGATKEKDLIDTLKELECAWEHIDFTIIKHKEINILIALDEIEAMVDDHSIKVLNMKSSVFVKPHETEVTSFYEKIRRIFKTIEFWSKVQNEWVRLFPILSTKNLSKTIPKESELFDKIKSIYNNYIEKIQEEPNVMRLIETTKILENIELCAKDVEVVHRGVVTYLETVRNAFPRLYFISNDELLFVLSDAQPLKSQTFLTKLFPGIHKLTMTDTKITGFRSLFKENFTFIDFINISQNILEEICSNMEQAMVRSSKHYIVECYKTFRRNNVEPLLSKFYQQIIQVVSQIFWTEHIRSALGLIHNIKLRIYYQKLNNSVKEKISIVKENNVTNLERLTLRNLIIDDLNLRYLITKLLNSGYISENQFDWEAHAKYTLENGLVSVELMNTKTDYKYEYLGNTPSIIMTPLTDRCYRTLVTAQQYHFCGYLEGPGNSGKSLTIKTLAGVFGVLLITINCLQTLNSSILIMFLKGSSLCGSWLCLKNLNNLMSDVLSSLAQNIFLISTALKHDLNQCCLEGTTIKVKDSWFVTACVKETYFHKELPDNLKALFRPTIIISPDIRQIIETSCYIHGLENANKISKKLNCVYNSFQDLMVNRNNYYFGVSQVEEIFSRYDYLNYQYPRHNEDSLLYNSIKYVFTPTMKHKDVRILEGVLRQVFTAIVELNDERTNLEGYVSQYCRENNLQYNENLSDKIFESYNAFKQAKGVIILGETFTGKSTILNICEYIFIKFENESLMKNIVNPSSLDYEDLYGKYDSSFMYWSDGILSKALRSFTLNEDVSIKWLILDGNIDSSWIENVNDILSYDSRYYLESGEVFIMKDTVVVFEVTNLESASPSTLSRCRVIYVPPSTTTWKDFTKSWINSCKSEWIYEHKEMIIDLLIWMISPCLDFIRNHCSQLCYVNEINLVQNVIHLTHIILDESFLSIARKEEDIKNLPIWIQATLVMTGINGLGSVLDKSSMVKFDEFYKSLWRGQNMDYLYPESFEKLEVIIPQDGLLCNYQYIFKQRGVWKLHQDFLKNEKIIEHPYMNEFLVPTADTLKLNPILTLHIKYQYPILLVGGIGTGKTLLIEHILKNNVEPLKQEISHINFNCNTNSRQTQKYIISKLNKQKNGFYSPPKNKNFLLFIDNLSLVNTDQQNSSPTLELLRQQLDNSVWYDLKSYNPIYLKNVNIISAMSTSDVKQNTLCTRLLRHFNIFSTEPFSDDNISKIYVNMLLHVWKKAGFSGDINVIINQIISATLRIYNSILKTCKPSLNKCYYRFNLSDFTKVIKGCCCLKKETYDSNKKIYVNLWAHEIQRVFGDRFDGFKVDWLLNEIRLALIEEFNEGEEEAVNCSVDHNNKLKTVFSTINNRDLPVHERRYEEVTDSENVLNLVNESLKIYNNSHVPPLTVTLFTYALDKLLKICRVISTSSGNALLLGEIGTGRQSLTKLACYLYDQTLLEPEMTKQYTIKEWDRDVKMVLKEAGAKEKQCVFLVTEELLIDELFLQNLDFILRGGEIPNLYDTDEQQEILELTRLSAQGGNRNLDISSSAVFLYFNKQYKENLHLILCHSIRNSFRDRIRRHPSLMTCHVIWFDEWPDESLEYIGRLCFKDINLPEDIQCKITTASIYLHRKSQTFSQEFTNKYKKNLYITSKAFIHLIKLFKKLLNVKQNEIAYMKKLYEHGLSKLSQAANQILNMQKSLAEYQPQLEEMTQKALEMTAQIALETVQVEKASAFVRSDEKVAKQQAAVAQVLKSECEAELAQAIPILEDAISALNTLKPTDITLVKSMKNPPDAIKLVMAAVCVMKDVKPEKLPDPSTGRKTIDYWGPSKRILGDMNFLQSLKDFDKDHIKPEVMMKIRKDYLPHKDFKPHIVAKASSAAEGLCKWIIAMDMYDKVAKEVAPKKEKLEKAEKEYADTMSILNEKKEELTCLEKKLAELNDFLDDAKQKQIILQKQVDYCNKKLGSAEKLILSLSEERSRWTETARNLETQYNLLPGDILIFSGIIAYLAPVNHQYRKHIALMWREYIRDNMIPSSVHYDITKLLCTEKEKEFWNRNELPNDNFFIVNALIQKFSQNYSIFIDPNYLATKWIQKIERKNKISLTQFTDCQYLEKIKYAIVHGKPILIHKIKQFIPPCLVELLQNQTFCENGDICIKLNNEPVRIDENFRLYMTCNLRFPKLSPEMYNRITLVNFEITEGALEAELLKTVIEIEKPELKNMKNKISVSSKRNKATLSELEEKILNTLCESQTDILEDENAIKILDEAKKSVKDVHKKQKEIVVIQNIVDNFKSEYQDVAKYAANLFPCVNGMKNCNYIYEFSLGWYLDQYFKSVLSSRKSRDTKQRCANIRNNFTHTLFYSMKNSFLENDHMVFLLLLVTKILIFNRKITKQELDVFLKSKSIGGKGQFSNEQILESMKQLEVPYINKFLDILKNESWLTFFEKPFIDINHFLSPWNTKLNNFQKLLLIKLLRPDQLFHNIEKLMINEFGQAFITTESVNLSEICNNSHSLSPIIFFLRPENNVTQKLINLAHKKHMINSIKILSFSEDQTSIMDSHIEHAQTQGTWVVVQNCHLSPKWLQTLENRLVEMDVENTHENFRLWLTMKPSKDIPIELLQESVKIVIEEQRGIKNKLKLIYNSEPIVNQAFYNGCPEKQKYFSRLLYVLSLFHSILQEKRNYHMFFSTTPYTFTEDDLYVSQQQLQEIVNQKTFDIEYLDKLTYIIANCNYSVENQFDVQLVHVLLDLSISAIGNRKFNNLELYGLPKKNDYKDYFLHISKLPDEDDPRLCGLNELTANLIAQERSKKIVCSVRNILEPQYKADLNERETDLINSVDDIMTKIFSLSSTSIEFENNVVLTREIKQYGILLNVILNSLGNIKKSFSGEIEITKENEEEAESIISNLIPDKWLKLSYPHQMTLACYVENLCQRIEFFKQLQNNSDRNRFWLAAFFFPKAFVCQIKIDFSKRTKLPLESITFDFEVLDKNDKRNAEGIIFDGLFIKGASWNRNRSQLSEIQSLYCSFPPIFFKPINEEDFTDDCRYICPIYQADNLLNGKEYLQSSQNFINSVLLPSDLDPNHWIKRGVKIICQKPEGNSFM